MGRIKWFGMIIMFGLTKKQFLKRSKSCVDETGNQALLIRELIEHEIDGNIPDEEAYKQIKLIVQGVEDAFFRYEALDPPSNCVSLHLKLLHSLITLQDAVAANYDFISSSLSGKKVESVNKLEESQMLLEKFRKEFRPITNEVDGQLNEYS
jgi:hypothetical protein